MNASPIQCLDHSNAREEIIAKGDLCNQPGCPFYGAGAAPAPEGFPPCPHMADRSHEAVIEVDLSKAKTDWFMTLFKQ